MPDSNDPSLAAPPSACAHSSSERRVRCDKLSRPLIAFQCCQCGARVSEDISPKKFTLLELAALPPWDKDATNALKSALREERVAERAKIREERRLQREVENELWIEQNRGEYKAYLRSEKWLNLRQLVLRRANDVCEGCGDRLRPKFTISPTSVLEMKCSSTSLPSATHATRAFTASRRPPTDAYPIAPRF